jgi:hypothetical protein
MVDRKNARSKRAGEIPSRIVPTKAATWSIHIYGCHLQGSPLRAAPAPSESDVHGGNGTIARPRLGANTAIFQLIDAIRLRSLAVAYPQELAYIDFAKGSKRGGWWSSRSSNFTSVQRDSLRDAVPGRDGRFAVAPGISGPPLDRAQAQTSAIGKLTALTPVVDHVGIGPIEPVRMRTLHGDTMHGHSISVGA